MRWRALARNARPQPGGSLAPCRRNCPRSELCEVRYGSARKSWRASVVAIYLILMLRLKEPQTATNSL